MPAFLIPVLGWVPSLFGAIKNNPNRTNSVIIYALIAGVIGLGVYFWVDYRGAKSALSQVRDDLQAEQALTAAQQDAINEFQQEQARFAALVREFDSFRAEVNAEVRELRQGLTAREIRDAAAEDPAQASDSVTGRVNNAFGLFDDATTAPD